MSARRIDFVPAPILDAARAQLERFRTATASRRPLPIGVLAGVQKGGTTSLYHQLRVHPNVVWALGKGTHFFDRRYDRGLDWYRARFPLRLRLRWRGLRVPGEIVTLESCGYYFDHPLAPPRCAETLPDARVVIMLRNPVDRAYSSYHDAAGKGFESLSFEEAIEAEPERLAGEAEKLVSDPGYYSPAHNHQGYLARGIYVDHVGRWIEHCGRERVLVMHSEAFYEDMASEYSRALRFLSLPDWAPQKFEKQNVASYAKIDPATRKRLVEYFAPHNRRLYELLGVDFGWR